MKIGYARVSSAGQSLEVQLEQLTAAGCEKIYREKKSGRSRDGRVELERALEDLRGGDELIVTRLDRLARSVIDLHAIVQRIAAAGAAFVCLQQSGVNTDTPTGKLTLGILALVAEFENDIRRERQLEGIQRAKGEGKYAGRKPSIDHDKVLELNKSMPPRLAAKAMKISRQSVYRVLQEHDVAPFTAEGGGTETT